MNLLHLKYALEVSQTGSINKAAEKLYVGQPNLSRAIKELEASLGVAIFDRSAKGMTLTPDGEIFVRYAKSILKQVDAVEGMFKNSSAAKKRFSLSCPRAGYISEAFSKFSLNFESDSSVEVFYKETNSSDTLKNILQDDYKIGIVRYADKHDNYYKTLLDEKGIDYELIAEFNYVLLVSEKSPILKIKNITFDELNKYIEIAHANATVPTVPFDDHKGDLQADNAQRRIFVFERSSQFELLSENPETFMWVSPVSDLTLKRYGLRQLESDANRLVYRDMLIHKKEYSLTDLDKLFISELCAAKRNILKTR